MHQLANLGWIGLKGNVQDCSLIEKRETTKHKEHMYCPIMDYLTMPPQKKIGLPFNCSPPKEKSVCPQSPPPPPKLVPGAAAG